MDTMLYSLVEKRTDLTVTNWDSNSNPIIYHLDLEQVTQPI